MIVFMLKLIDLTLFGKLKQHKPFWMRLVPLLPRLHIYMVMSQSKSGEGIVRGPQTGPAYISHHVVCELIICCFLVCVPIFLYNPLSHIKMGLPYLSGHFDRLDQSSVELSGHGMPLNLSGNPPNQNFASFVSSLNIITPNTWLAPKVILSNHADNQLLVKIAEPSKQAGENPGFNITFFRV